MTDISTTMESDLQAMIRDAESRSDQLRLQLDDDVHRLTCTYDAMMVSRETVRKLKGLLASVRVAERRLREIQRNQNENLKE